MKTVANITPTEDGGLALLCLMDGCPFGRVFDSMEKLEFYMQKHFKNAHGFTVSQRTAQQDGEIVAVPDIDTEG